MCQTRTPSGWSPENRGHWSVSIIQTSDNVKAMQRRDLHLVYGLVTFQNGTAAAAPKIGAAR
jgi:hypothetical protein